MVILVKYIFASLFFFFFHVILDTLDINTYNILDVSLTIGISYQLQGQYFSQSLSTICTLVTQNVHSRHPSQISTFLSAYIYSQHNNIMRIQIVCWILCITLRDTFTVSSYFDNGQWNERDVYRFTDQRYAQLIQEKFLFRITVYYYLGVEFRKITLFISSTIFFDYFLSR